MEPVHPLSAVAALEPDRSVVKLKRPRRRLLGRLLVISLVLNGAVALGAAAAAMTFHAQLDLLSSRAEQQRQQHAQGLTALGEQSRALEQGLVDVRTAVSSHSREEALFLKMLILKPGLDHALARRIAASVQAECTVFQQDPNLVLAIMAIESDFNPRAVSNQGAVGLMQVMPHWRKVLALPDLTEPEVSIRAGIQILGYYQQMYRDLDVAVTAYNRGPGPVDAALVHNADPSNGYAARVLSTWERLRAIDGAARP
jgi:hypothetical protein